MAGYRFARAPRLAGIKFPAAWRRNVYVDRPSHEQAAWFRRMETEPDFEARVLVEAMVRDFVPTGLTYRELVRQFVGETLFRIRRRFKLPWSGVRSVDEVRRFKGL